MIFILTYRAVVLSSTEVVYHRFFRIVHSILREYSVNRTDTTDTYDAEQPDRRPDSTRSRTPRRYAACSRSFALACVLLAAAGCGGGGGPVVGEGGIPREPAPTAPNPVPLAYRPIDVGTPAPEDPAYSRPADFDAHRGLSAISAEEAYKRGYFGQGVTIAIADDGMDIDHPDLAGRITAPYYLVAGNNNVFETTVGHGTTVAMIAAGAGGNAGGPFEITKGDNTAPITTRNVHGVAPQASIIPISLLGGGQPLGAMEYAIDNGAHVVNFSIGISRNYFGEYAGRPGVWVTQILPIFRPILDDDTNREFGKMAEAVKDSDIVMVWAAGNDGWNAEKNEVNLCGKNDRLEDGCALGQISVTAEEFMENFMWEERGTPFRDIWRTICESGDCIDYNSGGHNLEAPLFQPGLLGKWLVVAALDNNGDIADFSNGCGATRNWCLAAPGTHLTVYPTGTGIQGTSFSAPFVSGALAVLKSRLPSMRMEVVQALLLDSADPVGTRVNNPREPDAVYGWGRLNLGRAVSRQDEVHLPFSENQSGRMRMQSLQSLKSARITLSPTLTQMGKRLRGVEAAVGGVGGAYYNTNLFDAADIHYESLPAPDLGHAARDMLAPVGGYRAEKGFGTHSLFVETDPDVREFRNVGAELSGGIFGRWRLGYGLCDGCGDSAWREWDSVETAGSVAALPFFAHPRGAITAHMQGDGVRPFTAASNGRQSERAPWRQFGLQWRRQHGAYTSAVELSRIDEDRSVWGTNFGPLGDTRTRTLQGRLLLSAELRNDWQGVVGYEHSSAEVSATGGMLSGISGLRAEGWWMGAQGRGVFRDDDVVRLSARRETAVRGGQARIDHFVAGGSSFVDAFYHGHPQTLERRQTAVDLRTRPTTRYALGYARPIGETAQGALGLEYEGESGGLGVSTRLQMRF